MDLSLQQTRLIAVMQRSGMSDAQLATVLGVNQSTVSRLKSGKIRKVDKYRSLLEGQVITDLDGGSHDFAELIEMSKTSRPIRDILIALSKAMQEIA